MANHGTAFATRFKLMGERIQAMKQIWTQSTAAFDGELVKFEPMMQWPKPVQNLTRQSLLRAHFPTQQNGRSPMAMAGSRSAGVRWIRLDVLPQFRQMAKDAGRDPARRSPSTSSGRPETWRC